MDRRDFLSVAGGGAFLCTIGGKTLSIESPDDLAKADAAAAKVKRPRRAAREPVDSARFPTPEPQPGGQRREYWIGARAVRWNVVPTGRDEWMDHKIPRRRTFTAYVYQRYTAGFASPIGRPTIPGPTLRAEVGDTLVVNFRNLGGKIKQAVTMHPHGVRYTPDYDGAYQGDFTRIGGFIEPGEEFTYTWEATPDSVGVWPYHDHGPNHTINQFRGMFGTIIIRPRGAAVPDSEHVLFMHNFPPQVTGLDSILHCFNGHAFAGNAPTIRAKAGQRVAIHVMVADGNFHTFHIHGHRWKTAGGEFVDCPTVGPNETITAEFLEDNPGRWLYHCHVASHMDNGMAGWFIVDP